MPEQPDLMPEKPDDRPKPWRLKPYYSGMLMGALLVILYYEVLS